jgi:hypothetical protein
MNMVEIWFSILTKQQVRRGVYHGVPKLIAAIEHSPGLQRTRHTVRLDQSPIKSWRKPPNDKTLQTRCTRT